MTNRVRVYILAAAIAVTYFLVACASAVRGATITIAPGLTEATAAPLTQAQLDSAGDGGVIQLGTGFYRASSQLQPRAGQKITGTTQIGLAAYDDTTTFPGFRIPSWRYTEATPTVIINPRGLYTFKVMAAGASFIRLSPRDNAIWLEGAPAATRGLAVDQCWFKAVAPIGGDYNNIIYGNHCQDLRLTNSVFSDPLNKLDHCVFTYSAANIYAANLWLDGAGDGIHIADFGGATSGTIEEIYGTHQKRMAVEYQGGGNKLLLRNSWQQDSIFLADSRAHATAGNPNDNNLGYSLPSDASVGTTATGNVTIGPPAQPQAGVMHKQYFGYEFSGQDWRCSGNLIVNVEWPVAVTNKNAWGTATNNHIEQCGGFDVSIPALKKQLLERGRPGPMHRLGSTPPPPTLLVTAAVDMTQAKSGTYTLNISNPPAGVRAVRIHNRAKESQAIVDVETVGVAKNFDYAASITYSGGHPGWVQQSQVEFFDASARLLASSEWITLDRFPGSSTDPFPPATQPATQSADDPIIGIVPIGGYRATHASGRVEAVQ